MIKVHYICSQCDTPIDTIVVAELDETDFGFDCLTDKERREMLSFDLPAGILTVRSLCDHCIGMLCLADEPGGLPVPMWLH